MLRQGTIQNISSAHFLKGAGICEQTHGHTYKVEVEVDLQSGESLPEGRLESEVAGVLKKYDHCNLNQVMDYPSCENICQAIFKDIQAVRPGLFSVKVWEGDGKWAEVRATD